jgi:hypothetical protein
LREIDVYRKLNTFKGEGKLDAKGLSKKYGRSPNFWSSKKAVMHRSTIPCKMLIDAGFHPSEISPWVKRVDPKGSTDVPPGKTGEPQVETPREPVGHRSIEQGAPGAERVTPHHGEPQITVVNDGSTHEESYQGYNYQQLTAMTPDGLSRIGYTKIQGGLYRYTRAENGDIARAYIYLTLFLSSQLH